MILILSIPSLALVQSAMIERRLLGAHQTRGRRAHAHAASAGTTYTDPHAYERAIPRSRAMRNAT
jgi:hypothetical protein